MIFQYLVVCTSSICKSNRVRQNLLVYSVKVSTSHREIRKMQFVLYYWFNEKQELDILKVC